MKKLTIVIILILMIGTAAALSFNVIPAIKMHIAGTTLEESLVTVTDIIPIGNKKLNSVDVTVDNTDTIAHDINLYLSVEDIASVEIDTGTKTITVPVGLSTVNIPADNRVDMVDVVNIIITIREV